MSMDGITKIPHLQREPSSVPRQLTNSPKLKGTQKNQTM